MKKIFAIACLASLFALSGCDKIKDAVTINVDLGTKDIVIDDIAPLTYSSAYGFAGNVTMDPEMPMLAQLKDYIDEGRDITLKISSAELKVVAASGAVIENLNLSALGITATYSNAGPINLGVFTADNNLKTFLNAVLADVLAGNTTTISASGESSVSYDQITSITLRITMKAEVKPLK